MFPSTDEGHFKYGDDYNLNKIMKNKHMEWFRCLDLKWTHCYNEWLYWPIWSQKLENSWGISSEWNSSGKYSRICIHMMKWSKLCWKMKIERQREIEKKETKWKLKRSLSGYFYLDDKKKMWKVKTIFRSITNPKCAIWKTSAESNFLFSWVLTTDESNNNAFKKKPRQIEIFTYDSLPWIWTLTIRA